MQLYLKVVGEFLAVYYENNSRSWNICQFEKKNEKTRNLHESIVSAANVEWRHLASSRLHCTPHQFQSYDNK